MKRTLGRTGIVWWLLWLPLLLTARPFSLTITPETTTPYLKEAVKVWVEINQTDPTPVLLFDFAITPSKHYRAYQLHATHDNTAHHTNHRYLYEVYPLTEGNVSIDFKLLERVTNDEKVRYFASGDRDDFKKLDSDDTLIPVAPLHLQVKPLPKGTQLVGNFTLQSTLKPTQTTPYEPVAFQVTLEGEGFTPTLRHFIWPENNVTLFEEKPLVKTRHTKKGTFHHITYPMALSAPHSFTLPRTTIKAFDAKKQRSYTLTIPQTPIRVTPPKEAPVDTTTTPPPCCQTPQWLISLLQALPIFLAGLISGWLLRTYRTPKATTATPHPLVEKIEQTKEPRALLQLLLAHDPVRFAPLISQLNAQLYHKGKKQTLHHYKKEAKELLA